MTTFTKVVNQSLNLEIIMSDNKHANNQGNKQGQFGNREQPSRNNPNQGHQGGKPAQGRDQLGGKR